MSPLSLAFEEKSPNNGIIPFFPQEGREEEQRAEGSVGGRMKTLHTQNDQEKNEETKRHVTSIPETCLSNKFCNHILTAP